MTNPDNIVRVRARNGGRASVYEANGWAQAYTSGLVEGSGVLQNTVADMNVLVGGSTAKPDVVLAENPSGYKIALDLVGQQAVAITAPATNSRISAIVAYTDDLSLQSTEDTVTGSPASCGLIVVNGTAGATPSDPTDAQIRTAITSDGATGSQAAYCVIATIEVASNTTVITNSLISINSATVQSNNFGEASITADKLDFTTMNTAEIKTTSASIGYSITCAYKRLGNIVIATVDNPSNSTLPVSADYEPLSETVPVGFRPAYNTSLNLATGAIQSRTGNISFLMKSDGSIRLNSAHMGDKGAVRLNGVSVWFTVDAYPE